MILTALHVIVGDLKGMSTVAPTGNIRVRACGDFVDAFGEHADVDVARAWQAIEASANHDFKWRSAKLVWPPSGVRLPRFDLAILKLDDTRQSGCNESAPAANWLNPSGNVSCKAVGFPSWGWVATDEGHVMSQPVEVEARLTLGLKRIDTRRYLTVTGSTPPDEPDWSGLSGAVFFDEASGGIVGVASKTRPSDGNAGLAVTILADARGPEMNGFWNQSGLGRQPTCALEVTRESPTTIVTSADARHEEQRIVSVMSWRAMDLEHRVQSHNDREWRKQAGELRNLVERIVAKFRGAIVDAGNMEGAACFGYDVAAEDDAMRAVQAARSLMKQLKRSEEFAVTKIACGVSTGPLLVTVSDENGAVVAPSPDSKTLFLARALSENGGSGVTVDGTTREVLRSKFEFRRLKARESEGSQASSPWWKVTGIRQEGRWLTNRAFIADRVKEQEILKEGAQRVQEGETRIIDVVGEPGIGKSHLCEWFIRRRLHSNFWKIPLQCSAFRSSTDFWPIKRYIENAAHMAEGDLPAAKLARAKRIFSVSGAGSSEGQIQSGLNFLLSLPLHDSTLSPSLLRQFAIDLLVGWIQHVAAKKPILIFVEDPQWIDPSTEDLIHRLLDHNPPLPILCLIARREYYRSPWADYPNLTRVTLDRLKDSDSREIAKRACRSKKISPELQRTILERAESVPLFVEELARMVLELSADQVQESIPSTLMGLLSARLDKLGTAKAVAQLASVIGRRVPYQILSLVSPLDPGRLQAELASVVQSGLMFRQGSSDALYFTFRHALIRQAAYDMVLEEERIWKHHEIATAIERDIPAMVDQEPEILAYHYTQAHEPAKAINYCLKAAERAAQRSANLEALMQLDHAQRQFDQLADSDRTPDLELGIALSRVAPLIASQGYASAELKAVVDSALPLTKRVSMSSRHLPVLYAQYAHAQVTGHISQAMGLIEAFDNLAQKQAEDAPKMVAERLKGGSCLVMGRSMEARQHLETAANMYRPERDRDLAFKYGQDIRVAALGYLAMSLWHLGFVTDALRRCEEMLAWTEEVQHANTTGVALTYAAVVQALCRDAKVVRQLAATLRTLGDSRKLPLWSAVGVFFLGQSATLDARDQGIAQMQSGLKMLDNLNAFLFRPILLSWYADACAGDKTPMAVEALDAAGGIMASGGETWLKSDCFRVRGKLLAALGTDRNADAAKFLREAIRIAQKQSSKSLELRAATDLARLTRTGGDIGAVRHLCEWFAAAGIGETPDLADARSVIA